MDECQEKSKTGFMSWHEQAELFDETLVSRLAGGARRVDRDWLTSEVKACLDQEECRIVLLTGAPGTGKSAVMAHLAQERPDWPRYFIRRMGETDTDAYRHEGGLASFLTLVGFQLLALHPLAFPAANPAVSGDTDVGEVGPGADVAVIRIAEYFTHPFQQSGISARLKAAVVKGRATAVEIGKLVCDTAVIESAALAAPALLDPLSTLAGSSREPVVVLLDGLDELRFRDAATDVGWWLARRAKLPANLRVVVASRPDAPLVRQLEEGHKQSLRRVHVESFPADIGRDIEAYLRNLGGEEAISALLRARGISTDRFVRQLAPKVGGNFLYASMIARLLDAEAAGRRAKPAGMAPAPDIDWLDAVESLPGDLPGFYALLLWSVHDQLLRRPATQQHWDVLYRPLLGLLSVAAVRLTGGQLRAFGDIGLDQATVDGALERLEFFLDGDATRGYRFHHLSMAEYLGEEQTAQMDRPLYCDSRSAHGQITAHAIRMHQQTATWPDADSYLTAHLAAHAAGCDRLDELVEDPRYLLTADPDALVPELGAVDRAEPIARIYQQLVPMIRDGDLAGAQAHLKLYAEQAHLAEFAAQVATATAEDRVPWQLDYTRWDHVRVRQVLGQHDGEVTAIAIAGDADRHPLAVTGGESGQLRIWDLRRGRETRDSPLPGSPDQARMSGPISALAVAEADSGDAIAVTGSWDGAVRVWNIATGEQVGGPLIGAENAGDAVAAAYAGGTPCVVCHIRGRLRVWDLFTQTAPGRPFLAENLNREEAMAAAGYGGGLVFAAVMGSSSTQGRIRVWDTATWKPCGPDLRVADNWITAIALAEVAGRLLAAVADGDRGLQVFDAVSGEPYTERPVAIAAPLVNSLAVGTVKGRPVLATGDESGQIVLRELPSLRRVGDPVQAHAGPVTALTFAVDTGGWLASVGKEYPASNRVEASARFWVPEKTGRLEPAAPAIVLSDPARSVALAVTAGRMEAVIADGRQAVRLDVQAGQAVGTPLGGRNDRVHAVGVATVAGRTIAVGATYDATVVRTWDIPECAAARHPVTGRELVRKDLESVRGLAVTRIDERAVVVCAGWADIHIWDAATGEPAGPGLITGPRGIRSLAVGELNGRPIVACAGPGPDDQHVMVFYVDTGEPVEPVPRGASPPASAVAIAGYRRNALVVSGGSYLSLSAWQPMSGQAPVAIDVAGETTVLAAAYVGDRPMAVCSGRKGEVRLVDLAGTDPSQQRISGIGEVRSLAIAQVAGRHVVLCAGNQTLKLLDLVTGAEALPLPAALGRGNVASIAAGTLNGRPVVVAGGYVNLAWYLDSGDPLPHQPAWPDSISAVAVADVGGRLIAVAACSERVVVADLETGDLLGEPLMVPGGAAKDVSVAMVSGYPVLVTRTSMVIRAQFLDLPWLPAPVAGLPFARFAAQEETPPPPPMIFARRLTRYPHDGGWCMATGSFEDQPVVFSGHDEGHIDVFELVSGLPLQPRLVGGKSSISAVAFQQFGERPVIAVGSADGIVRVADLTDLSALTVITTLAPVWALALAEPGHCVIGTDRGLIAARVRFPHQPGQGQGTGGGVRLPVDHRIARTCPQHDQHRQVVDRDGRRVLRLCVKGVQDTWGQRAKHSLKYAGGHCYVWADHIEIMAGAEQALVLQLGSFHPAPVDDPEAYQTDGCHFGVALEEFVGTFRVLSCYRRSERDWLLNAITRGRRQT